jgi:ferredoxin-type protein NapH
LRRARRLLLIRRACLGISFAFAILVPLSHALTNAHENGVRDAPWARVPLLGAPWSVSLFGLEILDPLAFLGLAAARALSWPVVIGAIPALVLTVFLGRYFCSWLCPYAVLVGLHHPLRAALTRLGVPVKDIQLPPRTALFVLAGVLVVTAVTANQVAALVYPPALIGRALFKFVTAGTFGVGGAVLASVFLFDTFVSRAGFCRSLCPGGAVFRLLAWRSPVTVVRTESLCTSCTLCDVVCNMGQSPMTDRVQAGCDRCGRCESACPTGALDLVAIARRQRTPPTPSPAPKSVGGERKGAP